MKKKLIQILFILIMLITLSGCKDTTPRVFLSTHPIAKETFVPMEEFKKDDTINFVIIAPKKFQSKTVRILLIKKNGLSPIYGDKLALGKDYNVEHDYYLTGSFTVYEAGRYELRVYDSDGTRNKPTHSPAKAYTQRPDPLAVVQFGVFEK